MHKKNVEKQALILVDHTKLVKLIQMTDIKSHHFKALDILKKYSL